jgi:hypothetical protein
MKSFAHPTPIGIGYLGRAGTIDGTRRLIVVVLALHCRLPDNSPQVMNLAHGCEGDVGAVTQDSLSFLQPPQAG